MPKWLRVQQPWRNWDESVLRRNVGVYIHVPFCLARCTYCDFHTYAQSVRPAGLTAPAYQAALLAEIERRGAWANRVYGTSGRHVDSVFFGGGTPTSLTADRLCELISAVRSGFPLTDDAEVTVEANPDTLSAGYLAKLAAAGVNRLSIGIQATQSRLLRFMGRTHRFADIRPVLEALPGGPIRRYSFDLIYGVPGLTHRNLTESLKRLLAFKPEHISAYELTCEDGTPHARWTGMFPQLEVGAREIVAQRRLVTRALANHGLYRYEVSNYARPGAECRHNLRYWRGGDYVGLGLGAASRVNETVVNNPMEFEAYQALVESAGNGSDPVAAVFVPGIASAPRADLFLQLRTRAGISASGLTVADEWLRRGWLSCKDGSVEPSVNGLDYADLFAREMN